MKRILTILIFQVCLYALAEDIISMRDGEIIKAIVSDITQTEVKYKKTSNPQGPTYTISKNDVLSILFANGDIEKMEPSQTKALSKTESVSITYAIPAHDNQDIIARYNIYTPTRLKKQPSNKPTHAGYIYWGVDSSSVLSTAEIEIEIKIGSVLKNLSDAAPGYDILIKNKTKLPLYVDLAHVFTTFRHWDSEWGEVWYDNTAFNQSENTGGGMSLGLGALSNALGIGGFVGTLTQGIGIGGGSSKNVGVVKQMERVLTLAPISTTALPGKYYEDGKNICHSHEFFSYRDKNVFNAFKWRLDIMKPKESHLQRIYYINYSSTPDFSDTKIVPVILYSRAIYGTQESFISRRFVDNEGEFLKNIPRFFIWGMFKDGF